MHWLFMTLAGPRASFGSEAAVGGERDGLSAPSRSAMLGLLAAARGISRENEDALERLSAGLMFASRVNRSGSQETDYHTAQVAKRKDLKRRTVRTRADELDAPRYDLTTILSSRVYRCDFHATVTATYGAQVEPCAAALFELASALKSPQWMLYLGRKSSPLAWPLCPEVIESDSLQGAFSKYDALLKQHHERWPRASGAVSRHSPVSRDLLLRKSGQEQFQFSADSLLQPLLDPLPTALRLVARRDEPRNRLRWQFASRHELRWEIAREAQYE